MLEIENLHVRYGGIHALKGIHLKVESGKIVTLIGANGAGKSTTLRCIVGLVRSCEGVIRFNGENITRRQTHEIIRRGIGVSPEGRRVFPNLNVKENLELGAYNQSRKKSIEGLDRVYSLFPKLQERYNQYAGTLSGGDQQMLALGRALMSDPELVLLDEPSLGLAPLIVEEVFGIIRAINRTGTTVLLVEQNAVAALSVAHYAYVAETGEIVLEGTGEELLGNERVKSAYLGE